MTKKELIESLEPFKENDVVNLILVEAVAGLIKQKIVRHNDLMVLTHNFTLRSDRIIEINKRRRRKRRGN